MTGDYTVVYSNRRTVGISVERDGAVIVRAPSGMNESEVDRLVSSRRRWIDSKVSHPQKYDGGLPPPGKELVSGESMLYLGRNYRVEVVDSKSSQIELDQKFIVPRSVSERGREEFRQWYMRAAEKQLVPRASEWAKTLGVKPGRIRIADVKFRWGSCTPAGTVKLNWRLIKAPTSVGDYVIVHELAHLLEASHGDRFWSIVRSQIPKVDESRSWLRENGQLLEQDL
jgi:predicted metal-dependent hydrolase